MAAFLELAAELAGMIYIHVPFCTVKCAYCDFYSVARPDMADAFVDAVAVEYAARKDELDGCRPSTLYIGGGTPSLLNPGCFRRLVEGVGNPSVEEFTVEVNPDDVDRQHIEAWLAAGVNRVSMGVQSLEDAELKAVGRRHDSRQALEAIALLQTCGITNISADLIYGLPGQTPESFGRSMHKLLASGITHLSAYCLSYEEGTRLWRWREQGRVMPADEDTLVDMYTLLCRETAVAGFEHYEISNFAKPGYRSRHNSGYWRGEPYLGLGPGAHSLDCRGIRRYVPSDLRTYLKSPAAAAVVDEEDDTDRSNDRIMVSLRTSSGLNLSQFTDGEKASIMKSACRYLSTGQLVATDDGIVIPEKYWLLSDAIIRDLLL